MAGIEVAIGIEPNRPKECVACKRDYCFMHCKYLDAYVKWRYWHDHKEENNECVS